MKHNALARTWWLFFLLLVLNACTGVSVKDAGPGNKKAYKDRAEIIRSVSEWGLVAKISLDDGDQGGSGRLQWDEQPGNSTLDFHGAMGRGAWHLEIRPQGAVLREANGDEQSAPGVNELIQDRMGWPIPVNALQWWVRGLAAPGTIENEELDSEGLLVSIDQFGWRVEFNRYDLVDGLSLPKRLNATRDDYRVKLAIGRWRMDMNHATRD